MKIECVGSFLPPEQLVEARKDYENGTIDLAELRRIEDRAVIGLVERQLGAGMPEVTSGELRRTYWDKDFYFGLDGISRKHIDSGRIYQEVESATDHVCVNGRIGFNPEHPFFDDFRFLSDAVAERAICRQTLPSPADLYLEIMAMSDGHPERIYPAADSLVGDIATAYNLTLCRFYDLGCRSVQFDDTACGLLCQDNYTKRLLQGGVDLIALHDRIVALINDSIAGLPADMEISLYLSGGDTIVPEWEFIEYPDNIMPKILRSAKVGKFFMPFDTGNLYQPEVLRHVPAGRKVVLGVVDAHSPFPDATGHIRAFVEVARRHIGEECLSISPKTGFKLSSYIGRGLTYEDQWHKLAHLRTIV